MSLIHNSCAPVGRRPALSAGTARCSTLTSMDSSKVGRMRTARPIHSRLPARFMFMHGRL